MATRWAVANGNWSNTATWNGGTLPGVGDDVHAGGFTVTINQDVTCLTLRTDLSGSAPAGGTFAVSSIAGTRTITAEMSATGTTHKITLSATSGSLVINGTLRPPSTSNQYALQQTAAGVAITVNGDIAHNGASTAVVNAGTTLNLTVNGSVYGAITSSGNCINHTAGTNSSVIISGSVSGAAIGTGIGLAIGAGPATWSVGGNVSSGVVSSGVVCSGSSAFTGSVGGSVYGPSASAIAYGVQMGANGSTLVITGDVVSRGHNVIYMSGQTTSYVTVGGKIVNGLFGRQAIYSFSLKLATVGNPRIENVSRDDGDVIGDSGFPLVLTATNPPDAVDLRSGVSSGTLIIPDPSDVSLGVATDDTTGTAILLRQDVWDVDVSVLNTAGSLGKRVRSVSTPSTTGDQLAASLGGP